MSRRPAPGLRTTISTFWNPQGSLPRFQGKSKTVLRSSGDRIPCLEIQICFSWCTPLLKYYISKNFSQIEIATKI
jgi:hypothetical protein